MAQRSRWKDENEVMEWYRTMPTVEQLSVNAWLNRGDKRLLCSVARRIFVVRLSIVRAIEFFTSGKLA